MAQHDYNIANQSGADFRADLNNALSAIATVNSGATEPSTTFAHQLWVDTSSNVLKIRNGVNNAWYTTGISITASNTFTGDLTGDVTGNVTGNVTGDVTGDLTGNADTATTLATARTISLSGDVAGSASFDGSGDITITTTAQIDSIALGTDTTGDYVQSMSGGTGVTVTGGTGEGSTPSIAIGQAVATTDDVTFNTITATDEFIGDIRGAVRFSAKASVALSKGDVVYISGVSGSTPTVGKAKADDASKMPAFGFAISDANLNANVEIVTFGTLTGLDTSNVSVGQILYVSTTAGAYTTTAPSGESAQIQNIGKVQRSHATAGSIKVGGAGRSNATPNLNDGKIFIGNASNQTSTATLDTSIVVENTNLYYTTTRANTAIDNRVTNTFINNLTGVVADTSTALATARTISLGGDITGSASFDGTSDITITSTIQPNSVALGTDTTGNYVQTITGTANKITVTGSGSESADVTLTLPDDVQVANNLTVAGNLTVNGTLTYLNTTNLDIADNLFVLNAGLTGTPVNDSGMLINRGSSDNGIFMWDESADKFTLGLTTATGTSTGNIILSSLGTLVANLEGDVTGTVSSLSNHDTDDLAEGSTNLYYTDARSRSAISATGDISYNSSTGVISFTAGSGVTSVNTQTGAVVLDTDDISEGTTNQYFTTARARSSISASGDISYNSTTGVISFTASSSPVTSVNTQTGAVVLDSDDISEGTTNLYFTNARADARVNLQTGANLDLSSKSTSDLSEGTNLYHTTERVQDVVAGQFVTNGSHTGISFVYDDATDGAIDATVSLSSFSTSDLSEGTNLYYTDARFDTRLGTKSTSDLSEGTNLYFTNERVDDRVSALIQDGTGISFAYNDVAGTLTPTVSLSSFSTSDLSEGTNLYYTDARARAAISEDSTQLSYNSTTGVLSYTQGNTDTVSEGTTNLYYTDARANSAIDARVTKTFVDALNVVAASATGNAGTATALQTARNFSIAGDITASAVSFDGTGNVALSASIDANTVGITEINVTDGTNGQVLTTDGAGNLSFTTATGTSTTINNNADNRVITGSNTADTLNGEANFVFDGTNVGIGTSSPAAPLHVIGNDGVQFNRSGQTNGFLIRPNATTDGIRFTQAGTGDRMTINSSGNVGIGTSSPTDKLHVVGTSFLNGNTYVGSGGSGNIYLSSGTGIYMDGGTGSANQLDDYEEGTWTPSITFGGGSTGLTHNIQQGKYLKVGRLVYVQCHCSLSNKGTSSGVADVNGLPFAISVGSAGVFSPIGDRRKLNTGGQPVNAFLSAGGNSYLRLYENGFDGTGNTTVTNTNFQNDTDIDVNIVYYTDS